MHYLHSQLSIIFLTSLPCLFLFTANFTSLCFHSAMEKPSLLSLTDSTSSDSPLHSSTLHTAQSVSDMDEKMRAIAILLEEDEHCQNRKLQIKHMLEEYNGSYQSLAEKYDYLRFLFVNILYPGLSSSSDAEMATRSRDVDSAAVARSLECNDDIFNKEFLVKLRDELVSSKLWNQCGSEEIVEVRDKQMYGGTMGLSGLEDASLKMDEFEIRHPSVAIAMWESRWNEMNSQVAMLMEENLQHQEELARRNSEKRVAIKELQQQIEGLKSENRALQISLRFTKEKLKPHRSQISRLADTISNKLLRRGCS